MELHVCGTLLTALQQSMLNSESLQGKRGGGGAQLRKMYHWIFQKAVLHERLVKLVSLGGERSELPSFGSESASLT